MKILKIFGITVAALLVILMLLGVYGKRNRRPAISDEAISRNRKFLESCDTKVYLSELDQPETETREGFKTVRWAIIKVIECPETLALEEANIITMRYEHDPKSKYPNKPINVKQRVPWLTHPKRKDEILQANLPSKLLKKSEIKGWWNLPDGEFSPIPYKVTRAEMDYYRQYDKL